MITWRSCIPGWTVVWVVSCPFQCVPPGGTWCPPGPHGWHEYWLPGCGIAPSFRCIIAFSFLYNEFAICGETLRNNADMLCLIPVPWELASSDDTCPIQSLPDWWQNVDFPMSALSLCLKVSPQHSTVSESPPFSPFLSLSVLGTDSRISVFSGLYFITDLIHLMLNLSQTWPLGTLFCCLLCPCAKLPSFLLSNPSTFWLDKVF